MTVDDAHELNLSWLHCNECHRSFEHHNRLSSAGGDGLRVLRSDLMYSFTSCGHFFCNNCIQQHTIGGKFICVYCQDEASTFHIDNHVPKSLEMYLKPPITQLEDAISVMTFQITNANGLIKSLRTKVAQQKELLSKAKQELASQKLLKEKVNELQQENEKLRRRLDDVTRAAGSETPNHRPSHPQTPVIHVPGRLSLRSPMRVTAGPPAMSLLKPQQTFPSQQVWHAPRSPSISEIFTRNAGQGERMASSWESQHQPSQTIPYYGHQPPSDHHLAQAIYNTPDSHNMRMSQVPRTAPIPSGRLRPSLPPSPSPRPVQRTFHTRAAPDGPPSHAHQY